MTLDLIPVGRRARIVAIDWAQLVPEEAHRLRALGIDVGARVAVAHRGVFAGRDPLAIIVGRMTVALRRGHARAMTVEEAPETAPQAPAKLQESAKLQAPAQPQAGAGCGAAGIGHDFAVGAR